MAWEENSCISLNMQLIAILSRIGVLTYIFHSTCILTQLTFSNSLSISFDYRNLQLFIIIINICIYKVT